MAWVKSSRASPVIRGQIWERVDAKQFLSEQVEGTGIIRSRCLDEMSGDRWDREMAADQVAGLEWREGDVMACPQPQVRSQFSHKTPKTPKTPTRPQPDRQTGQCASSLKRHVCLEGMRECISVLHHLDSPRLTSTRSTSPLVVPPACSALPTTTTTLFSPRMAIASNAIRRIRNTTPPATARFPFLCHQARLSCFSEWRTPAQNSPPDPPPTSSVSGVENPGKNLNSRRPTRHMLALLPTANLDCNLIRFPITSKRPLTSGIIPSSPTKRVPSASQSGSDHHACPGPGAPPRHTPTPSDPSSSG
ncbi:uncharacterized protein J3D65DRAFT_172761 [Phyllosticta citribraziliensis]|uniref:Uncharacterized protein n=1 Tax=Phyllosticta citribraziliensis TaxID=989973 RepID=A0ABR1L2Y4_9PEZI